MGLRRFTGFAMVPRMPEEQIEPGNLTERFRAFAQSVDPEDSGAPRILLVAVGLTLLLVLAVVFGWLVLAG